MVKLLNFSTPGLAQPLENSRGVRDRARDDFANRLVRFILGDGTAAVGDELINVEHDRVPRYGANGDDLTKARPSGADSIVWASEFGSPAPI